MIIDKLENFDLYKGVSSDIAKAIEYIKANDFSGKTDGNYEIDGEDMFLVVANYEVKPIEQGRLESHRKYIDLQVMLEGSELVGYCHTDGLVVTEDYNAEKDVMFYEPPEDISIFNFPAGFGALFFTHDAHMPGVTMDEPEAVKKIVIKIPV